MTLRQSPVLRRQGQWTLCAVVSYSTLLLLSELEQLEEECNVLKGRYYSEASIGTRASQIKKYEEFCEEYRGLLKPYPCDSRQLCLYVTYMSKELKYSSIKNYVSGLNDHMMSLGYPQVDYTNYGYKRCIGAPGGLWVML